MAWNLEKRKAWCLWSLKLSKSRSAWLSTNWLVYCPYQEKGKGSKAPSSQDRTLEPWSITMFIVTDYTRIGQHIFTREQWISLSWAVHCSVHKTTIHLFFWTALLLEKHTFITNRVKLIKAAVLVFRGGVIRQKSFGYENATAIAYALKELNELVG